MGASISSTKNAATVRHQHSTAAAQAEAYSDRARAGHDEIDAEEQAEDIDARARPARQDEQAEQQLITPESATQIEASSVSC